MRVRWAIAVVGVLALSAIAANFCMPWLAKDAPMPTVSTVSPGSSEAVPMLACPADAKPANLNFTLKNVEGQDVRLADYKGKVILLDFWATWCGPCKVEIPGFVEFQHKYNAAGLQVLGVSVVIVIGLSPWW